MEDFNQRKSNFPRNIIPSTRSILLPSRQTDNWFIVTQWCGTVSHSVSDGENEIVEKLRAQRNGTVGIGKTYARVK